MDCMVCYLRDPSRPLAFGGSLSPVVGSVNAHLGSPSLPRALFFLVSTFGGIIVHAPSSSFRYKIRTCVFGDREGMDKLFIAQILHSYGE